MSSAETPTVPTLRDAERYVGLAYEPRVFDCMHLADQVRVELFGGQAWPDPPPHPGSRLRQADAVHGWRGRMADPVEQWATGDAVLFIERDERGRERYHIGTLFEGSGQWWVLHIRAGGHSLLSPLQDALRQGLSLEGVYRWRKR